VRQRGAHSRIGIDGFFVMPWNAVAQGRCAVVCTKEIQDAEG